MEESRKSKTVQWLKRMGIAGFLFFLIKGLVWIALAYFSSIGMLSTCN